MVAVASGANKDETDTIRAVETLYSIRQSDIYEFILSVSDNKDRIERIMNERFDEKEYNRQNEKYIFAKRKVQFSRFSGCVANYCLSAA